MININAMQPTIRLTVSALLPRRRFRSFWIGRRCGLRLIATVTRRLRACLDARLSGKLPVSKKPRANRKVRFTAATRARLRPQCADKYQVLRASPDRWALPRARRFVWEVVLRVSEALVSRVGFWAVLVWFVGGLWSGRRVTRRSSRRRAWWCIRILCYRAMFGSLRDRICAA